MAPYTMTIELKNDSDRYIAFVGPSTLTSLDGTTKVETTGDVETVKVSKSGGTDGLFTALSFVAANGADISKNVPFTVWATMGAAAGSTVSVKLVDATSIIDGKMDQLRTGEWANRVSQHGDWHQDSFDRSKFNISLEKISTEYPNSYFKLHIHHS